MAGALVALRIPHGVVQQFDRNVIFCRYRGADFAAFGSLPEIAISRQILIKGFQPAHGMR
jgi:hypothetical protein